MCPSYLHMQHLEEGLGKAARRVALGAQDVYHAEGAQHTGAVTAEMLFDFGATWTLVGHSERRRDALAAESDEAVALKARHATTVGLSVVACVGESAEERDAGHGIKVITRQLETLAKEISFWDAVAIAYEPIWAINTGHIASLEHVQEARALHIAPSLGRMAERRVLVPPVQMHEALRSWVRQHVSPTVADNIRILYGGALPSLTPESAHGDAIPDTIMTYIWPHPSLGSVSMDNCEPLAGLADVDGFLVGGAATRLVYAGSPGVKVRGGAEPLMPHQHGSHGSHGSRSALTRCTMQCDATATARVAASPRAAVPLRASLRSWSAVPWPRTTPPRARPALWRARPAWRREARTSRAHPWRMRSSASGIILGMVQRRKDRYSGGSHRTEHLRRV